MSTASLNDLMAARRAELVGDERPPDVVEVIPPADPVTGEIVPLAAAEAAPLPAAPEPPTQFPLIPPKVLGGLPYASSYMKLAKTIHQTELVPKAFQGRPDAIMAAMMYGYELGLGPMQALNGLHVIDGKVGQDAELMRALITEAGHLFVLQVGTNAEGEPWAAVYCRRKDWPEDVATAEFTYTYQDGREAGLVEWYEKWTTAETGRRRKLTWNPHGTEARPEWMDRQPEYRAATSWQNFGQDMVIARVTARAARANFADVLKGMSYTPEELREFDGGNAAPAEEVSPSPPPATTDPVDGRSVSPTTESTAQDSPAAANVSPTPSSASGEEKPKRPRGRPRKKVEPIRTQNPQDLPGATDSADAAPASPPSGEISPSETSADEPASASSELPGQGSLVPTGAGAGSPTTPVEPPAISSDSEPGEASVQTELVVSLRALLRSRPAPDAAVIQAFLGQHFSGRKADQLNSEELTKAINIVGGWPESADAYPAPEPEGDDF